MLNQINVASNISITNTRINPSWTLQIAFILAIGLSLFQIWQSMTAGLPATYLRPLYLSWVLILIFMRFPLVKDPHHVYYHRAKYVDTLLCLAALFAAYRIISFDYTSIDYLLYGLKGLDLLAGGLMILLLLEGTRRSLGPTMSLIGIVFLLYCALGHILPDFIANKGFSIERIIRYQIFTASGIFGTALGVAINIVFVFVLFGAFLEITGAGKFFIHLAYAIAGKYRGGPAKASALASAALGSISGSAIANTATSGALTIPMMKRLGYKSHQAAGIEAAASTGGQIMPPIMGAGAFIMAEFTNTSYGDIILMSIAPAILYFGCTLLYIHLMACKLGLKGLKRRSPIRHTLAFGIHFLMPLMLITVLLLLNYSPTLVGISGCAAILVAAMLRKHTRFNLRTLLKGMEKGAVMALPISAACATAGIVVGVIGQTGLGLQFTEAVISFAHGQLWLALILVSLTALILGMGLPVTAAYIVIAVVAGPALSDMGVSLIAAHMIIFWLSQTSNITPPVALAAFTGAGIAGAKPLPSSITSLKLAQGFFIIPLMMAYTPLLWISGETHSIPFINAILFTTALIIAMACSIEGYLLERANKAERILFILAIPCLLLQFEWISYMGIILVLTSVLLHVLRVTCLSKLLKKKTI